MPQQLAESSWGSFRAGRWAEHDETSYRWDSAGRDPYDNMLVSFAIARSLRRSFGDTNARDFAQALSRRGVSLAFPDNVSFDSSDDLIDMWIDSQGGVNHYLEIFKTDFWFEDMLRRALSRREGIAEDKKWVCINPNCYFVDESNLNERDVSAATFCNNCGDHTLIHSSMISADAGARIIPAKVYRSRLDDLIRIQNINKDMLRLVNDSGGVLFIHWPYNILDPMISVDAKLLTSSKNHHITKRANYISLSRMREPRGFNSDARGSYDNLGWRFAEIRRMRVDSRIKFFDALQRFANNPNEILDEEVANELRRELVDASWMSGGRRQFGQKLDVNGLLKISPDKIPKEFIDLLYNKLINSSHLNIIIQRNGKIDYRLDRITTKIPRRVIEQAFEITEAKGSIEDMFDVASLV